MTFTQEVVSIMTCIMMGFFPGLVIGAIHHKHLLEEDDE